MTLRVHDLRGGDMPAGEMTPRPPGVGLGCTEVRACPSAPVRPHTGTTACISGWLRTNPMEVDMVLTMRCATSRSLIHERAAAWPRFVDRRPRALDPRAGRATVALRARRPNQGPPRHLPVVRVAGRLSAEHPLAARNGATWPPSRPGDRARCRFLHLPRSVPASRRPLRRHHQPTTAGTPSSQQRTGIPRC
jgi:hypothetical protein